MFNFDSYFPCDSSFSSFFPLNFLPFLFLGCVFFNLCLSGLLYVSIFNVQTVSWGHELVLFKHSWFCYFLVIRDPQSWEENLCVFKSWTPLPTNGYRQYLFNNCFNWTKAQKYETSWVHNLRSSGQRSVFAKMIQRWMNNAGPFHTRLYSAFITFTVTGSRWLNWERHPAWWLYWLASSKLVVSIIRCLCDVRIP